MDNIIKHYEGILNKIINSDAKDEYKQSATDLINKLSGISTDEEKQEWIDETSQVLNDISYNLTHKTIKYDEYLEERKQNAVWDRHYDFDNMDLNKMLSVFKKHKDKIKFEDMIAVIPFKDEVAYIDDLLYILQFIFNWQDIPDNYDVTIKNKTNTFLKNIYPYTNDFNFISIKSIKNFVNVYNKIMDIDRKKELCNKIVSKLLYTEGDLQNYQKSYNILLQLNKDGIESIINKYKFVATMDNRPIEDMPPEEL